MYPLWGQLFYIKNVRGDTVFWRSTSAPHPLLFAVIGGASPPLGHAPFGWLITVPYPLLERWLITVPPPLLGKGDLSHVPPFGSPSPWAFYRLVRPHLLAFPPPEKEDSPLPPLPSSWCLLQTVTPPPLCVRTGPPPLGACYRLVRPLSLAPPPFDACYRLEHPLPLAPPPIGVCYRLVQPPPI